MTIADALRGINAYPLPQRMVEDVATRRGLNLDVEALPDILLSEAFNLARADLLDEYGEQERVHTPYGYKGSRL